MYHLGVIERSLKEFRAYLQRKLAERDRLLSIVGAARFNGRQQDLLTRVLREPTTSFTYGEYARMHAITPMTARADLLDLEKLGLLKGNRVGRKFEFVASPDLEGRLAKLAKRRS